MGGVHKKKTTPNLFHLNSFIHSTIFAEELLCARHCPSHYNTEMNKIGKHSCHLDITREEMDGCLGLETNQFPKRNP